MRIEQDQVELVAGVLAGQTMGGPVTLVIRNRDWANWTGIMDPINPIADDLSPKEQKLAYDTHRARPGHADLAGGIKWHHISNADLFEDNPGRDSIMGYAGVSFPF